MIAVVQFGFAMIPRWFAMSFPLISGTTNGTSSCIRCADELSMTIAPDCTAIGRILQRDGGTSAEKRQVDVLKGIYAESLDGELLADGT